MTDAFDLSRVDWAGLSTAHGSAAGIPQALTDLRAAQDEEHARAAYWRIDNVVVVQNVAYDSAVAVVPFLYVIATHGSLPARRRAADLLVQIASAVPEAPGTDPLDDGLRQALYRGVELAYDWLEDRDDEMRTTALYLLAVIECDERRFRSVLRSGGRDDNGAFGELIERLQREWPDEWTICG